MSGPIERADSNMEILRRVDAHQQINTVLARLSRGVDRLDRDLIVSCYHPDAIDDHGSFKGSASEFADWVIARHRGNIDSCMHLLCNTLIEIDGDTARCESYVVAVYRFVKDGVRQDMFAPARYLDLFERRNTEWKISNRLVVSEKDRLDPVLLEMKSPLTEMLTRGERTGDDVSYAFFSDAQ